MGRTFTLFALLLLAAWHVMSAESLLVAPSQVPRLTNPATYHPDGDTITVEISQYAGYAGLVLAMVDRMPRRTPSFTKITISKSNLP